MLSCVRIEGVTAAGSCGTVTYGEANLFGETKGWRHIMKKVHELIVSAQEKEDKSFLPQLLELLKTEEGMYAVTARITNNFYMGTENGKAAAFIYTEKELAEKFVKELKWIGVETKSLEIRPEQRIHFFNDLYRGGFEALVIDKNHDSFSISLFSIIEKPENQDGVLVNPELMRAAARFYQSLVSHTAVKLQQDLMCSELYKARFLVPVADLKKTTPPLITDNKGGKYIPIFTDWVEFGKFDKKHRFTGNVVKFRELKKLVSQTNGIVVNPFGFGLKLDVEKLERIEKENNRLKVVK